VRLTVLGSGTSVPSTRRGSPCCLVRAGEALALVDSGPGALRQLARLGVPPNDLSDLFYTHAHLDHTSDLWPFLFVSNSPLAPRRRPLRLHGSPGFFDFYRRVAAAIGGWVAPDGWPLLEVRHLGEPVELGRGRVSGHPVPHIASSIAYRFEEEGRVLVISGDTDYGPGIVEAARGADLLVLECATPDGQKLAGHLTPSLCARVAAEAAVRRLVLTHFYPPADGVEVRATVEAHWPGDVVVAEDFLELEV
jgi:ribonuclease BN (tRNA processing enzyme)